MDGGPGAAASAAASGAQHRPVTVVCSDLSGYTEIAEQLDREGLREIMSRLFGEISQVVARYEGHVDRFIGDQVMAFFGVPFGHEDDSIRAVRAALEIHDVAQAMSAGFEKRFGLRLVMHTGVNTGLVIVDDRELREGTGQLLGDCVNVASRLTTLAGPGEILVGHETWRLTEGHFEYEDVAATRVKGRSEPVRPHRVVALRERPATHRLSGRRANLVGRSAEIQRLSQALHEVEMGASVVVPVCGEAGTGKSRLVDEFRASLDLKRVQWREGRCLPFTQSTPYAPLVDLYRRAWNIDEGASMDVVREQVGTHMRRLLGSVQTAEAYVGSLFGLEYPELRNVDPEYWQRHLHEAVRNTLAAIARAGPTIICIEDLHWADPSSVALLRRIVTEMPCPAMLLLTYRPPFSLLPGMEGPMAGTLRHEVSLGDLSPTETSEMTRSLLEGATFPDELDVLIHDKTGGNPFHVEELLNSLIERDILVRSNGDWRLERSLDESEVPLTVNGVISARLDRLDPASAAVVREASVVGRVFSHDVLRRITDVPAELDQSLQRLEHLDIIRTRALTPDIEYTFKHALTQDVAYTGLLAAERQLLHERTARAIEEAYAHNLALYFETLAFHFMRGESEDKAVDYLMRSADRSVRRYALGEADQYCREAFSLVERVCDLESQEICSQLVDIMLKWMLVHYYRGRFTEMDDLLAAHEGTAKSCADDVRLGAYYSWRGMARMQHERFDEAFGFLSTALELGEKSGAQGVVAHACTWLAYTCADLGRLDEAVEYGQRVAEIGPSAQDSDLPYHLGLGGLGYAYWAKGDRERAHETGKRLLEYGREHSNIRAQVFGHWVTSFGYMMDGNYAAAIECNRRAMAISADPWYAQFPRLYLGICCVQDGRYEEAEEPLEQLLAFCEAGGGDILATPGRGLLGAVLAVRGEMAEGLEMLDEVAERWARTGCVWRSVNAEYVHGNLFLRLAERAGPRDLRLALRNWRFLLRNMPGAAATAEQHLQKAIDGARSMGAEAMLGQALLDMGRLHALRGRHDRAREALEEAAACFERCGIETHLASTRTAIGSLA